MAKGDVCYAKCKTGYTGWYLTICMSVQDKGEWSMATGSCLKGAFCLPDAAWHSAASIPGVQRPAFAPMTRVVSCLASTDDALMCAKLPAWQLLSSSLPNRRTGWG
jgi:hypothetical protein